MCGEWGVRWFSYTFQSANIRYQVHRELRYTLRKGYRIDQEGEPYESSNRFGFRGSSDMRRDKGNRFRIVAIGDSVTFGLGVSDSETYPQQLEDVLNWKAGGRHFEVLNAGLPGYSPIQSRLNFELRLISFRPDLVIWQFIEDDVTDVLDYRPLSGFRYFLRRSALYWYLAYRWGDLRHQLFIRPNRVLRGENKWIRKPWIRRVANGPSTLRVMPANRDKLRAQPIVKREIQRFHKIARLNNAQSVMVFFPYMHYALEGLIPSTDAWLSKLSLSEQYNYLSFTRLFVKNPAVGESFLYQDTIHPNQKGYSLVVWHLAENLQKMGLLRPVLSPRKMPSP